jgi:hypothetical protein
MILNFEFQIPKQTSIKTPHVARYDMGVNASFIKSMEVYIPEGHKGLAGIKISTSQRQLMPAIGSNVLYIRGDKQNIPAIINLPVPGVPYYLLCEGYNEDSFLPHSFFINVEV